MLLKNKTNTIEKNKKSLFLHKTYCSRIHSSSILWQSTKSWVEVFFQGTLKLVAHFFKACMLFYHLFLVQVAAGSTNLIMFSCFIFIKPRQSLYLTEWCFKVVLTHSTERKKCRCVCFTATSVWPVSVSFRLRLRMHRLFPQNLRKRCLILLDTVCEVTRQDESFDLNLYPLKTCATKESNT